MDYTGSKIPQPRGTGHLARVDWDRSCTCNNGEWIHNSEQTIEVSDDLEILITIPPKNHPDQPLNRPLLLYLTCSTNIHLQYNPVTKKSTEHCELKGFRYFLENFVIVSVAWTKARYEGFTTPAPMELYEVMDELTNLFTNIEKRFLVGFSRGAMQAMEVQYFRPKFAQLHIVIAAYYPDKYERLRPRQFVEEYEKHETEIWFLTGSNDAWRGDVDYLYDEFLSNKFVRERLIWKQELPRFDHGETFQAFLIEPGYLEGYLKERIQDKKKEDTWDKARHKRKEQKRKRLAQEQGEKQVHAGGEKKTRKREWKREGTITINAATGTA